MPTLKPQAGSRSLFLACLALFGWLVLITPSLAVHAEEISVEDTGMTSLPISDYLEESTSRLNWYQARDSFNSPSNPDLKQTNQKVLSFGIGQKTKWIRFTLNNLLSGHMKRYLLIDSPWIDHLNLFQLSASGELINSQSVGDHEMRSTGNGPKPGHIFSLDIEPGVTTVLIRVETPDPMVLPIYQLTEDELDAHLSEYYYDYGFGYGYLLALIVFNALLYTSLRDSRYLFYAIYLGTFTFMNMSYSGLGQQWLWPGAFEWQRWAPPMTMTIFSIAGLFFAINLLEIQKHNPRLYRIAKFVILVQLLGQVGCWLFGLQAFAFYLAFFCICIYTLLMGVLGISSYYHAETSTKYYMFAVGIGLIGVLLTVSSMWGLVGYTRLGYHAVEISMLLESTFLALALADRVRHVHIQQARAEHLANTDPLTGLNNRRAFYLFAGNIWGNHLRHGRALSAIMVDIDHFKKLNDQYGHAIGDQVLVHMSKLLSRKARQGDIIARWGGEEFLILLPDTTKQEAVAIAERFLHMLQINACKTQIKQIHITASFGVSEASPTDTSIDDVIERADGALYEAKMAGRNRVMPA